MTLTAYLSKVLGKKPEEIKIYVHESVLGGGFGGKQDYDEILAAAYCAKEVGRPGQTDPDPRVDVRHQLPAHADLSQAEGRPEERPTRRHGPRHLLRLDGRRASPSARSTAPTGCSSIPGTPRKRTSINGRSAAAITGTTSKNHRVRAWDSDRTTWAVQASALRTVSNSYNMFVVESFMDEVAHALGRDPLEFRLSMLNGKGGNRGIPNTGYPPGTPSDYYMDRLWISLPWPNDNSGRRTNRRRWAERCGWPTACGSRPGKGRLGLEEAAAEHRHGHRGVFCRRAAEPDVGRRRGGSHRRSHRPGDTKSTG